jgi:DNA-binding transcriptional MerR regulator
MLQTSVVIPEKIFFKIGEVCDLVGVQAHVLRYWETEFPMFSPQKNRSGQRTYRRRDVEIAVRIKELLYSEMFTIAGAKKKLAGELRDGSKSKAVETEKIQPQFDAFYEEETLIANGKNSSAAPDDAGPASASDKLPKIARKSASGALLNAAQELSEAMALLSR